MSRPLLETPASAAAVVVHGRVALYIDGDIGADAFVTITLDAGSELDIFVSGTVTASSTFTLGSPNYPALTQLYVGGSQTLELSSTTVIAGNIYAPNALVRWTSNTDMYGALFAGDFEVTAELNLHHDQRVVQAGDTCSPPGTPPGNPPGGGGSSGGCSSDSTSGNALGSGDASGSGGSSGGATASSGGSGGGSAGSSGGSSAGTRGSGSGAGGSSASGDGGTGTTPTYEQAKALIDAYHAAHPGRDGDINAKTAAQLASDPDAQRLRSICGADQLPVIPLLAWEYGGSDHAWINPEAAALVYCVYIPVNPGTDHFNFDATSGKTTADRYVLFPDQNPCKDIAGADQVMSCIGDPTDGSSSTLNIEILVDTININDGTDVGLSLSTTPTDVMLIQPDSSKILMYNST